MKSEIEPSELHGRRRLKSFSATRRALAATVLAVTAASALAGCSGDSVEGTYYGTAGDTVLILESGGTCFYTDDHDEGDMLDTEEMRDCTWTRSDATLTFINVSRHGSLVGALSDDGSISLPDQDRWNGEIYTKK